MAGLVGVCSCVKRDKIEQNWSAMLSKVATSSDLHTNEYQLSSFKFARAHLNILNPHPQPIFNEDKSLFIFFEGEIFDYEVQKQQLIRSGHIFKYDNDPEFILHLYEEMGEDFLRELNGSFVVFIFDVTQKRLILANDRYGYRQLYYRQEDGNLIFASRIDAVVASGMFKPTLCVQAMASFFNCGQMLDDETWVSQVKVFPPGSILTWQAGKCSLRQYWDFNYTEGELGAEEDIACQLAYLFEQGIKRQITKKGGKLGSFLSGGLDSRLVTMAAVKKESDWSTVTFGTSQSKDVVYAKIIAGLVGTKHYHYPPNPDEHMKSLNKIVQATEGMTIPVNVNTMHLRKLIRDETEVKIFFHGFAGDLILGGSYFFTQIIAAKNENEIFEAILTRHYRLCKSHMEASLFNHQVFAKIRGLTEKTLKDVWQRSCGDSLLNRHEHFALLTRVRRMTQLGLASADNDFILRLPFYDNDFLDFIMRVPVKLRLDHRIYLKVMGLINKEMLEIPYQKTGKLPDGRDVPVALVEKYNLNNLQSSFTDYTEWSRRNNSKYFKRLIESPTLLDSGLFQPDYVNSLLDSHLLGWRNYLNLLFALIVFDQVCQTYFPKGVELDL